MTYVIGLAAAVVLCIAGGRVCARCFAPVSVKTHPDTHLTQATSQVIFLKIYDIGTLPDINEIIDFLKESDPIG